MSEVYKRILVEEDGAELPEDARYVIRELPIPTRMRCALYEGNGELKSAAELAKLGLTVREYTKEEWEARFYANLYSLDAAGDGALATRVRQYKGMLDTLGLAYDSTQDVVMAAIQGAEMEDKDKAALALAMKTIYDAVTTNLEFYGSETPHKDTYEMMANLIKYLPAEEKEGE